MPDLQHKEGFEMKFREWQENFLRVADKDDFLLVACPGAGKTIAALEALRSWWRDGSRAIVVVPTDHLKRQWRTAMQATLGLEMSTSFQNRDGVVPRDLPALAATYAQVASEPLIFRRLCSERRTMVILDEVHHCAEPESWGLAAREAFAVAARRLCLSGTPFRGDNNKIPFVRYVDSVSEADFSYGYDAALVAGVCREIYFPSFEGEMEWVSFGTVQKATFADTLSDVESARRLRTALRPESEWIKAVLAAAHTALIGEREDDPRAGGLILAIDTAHAEALADVMASITGDRPVIVTSTYEDSSARIEHFAKSDERWVVAVKQISEGVDIPRLRVLVYATTVKTELFFRQAVGRIARGDGMAQCFLPADPELVAWARRIQDERKHVIEEDIKAAKATRTGSERQQSLFVPIGATAADLAGAHLNGSEYSANEIRRAEALRSQLASKISVVEIARILRAAGSSSAETATDVPPSTGATRDRDGLKRRFSSLVRQWAYREHRGEGRPDFRSYQRRANTEPHGHYVAISEATIAELDAAITWVATKLI